MGSPAVTQSGTVLCLHGGQAQPASPLPRVKLSGASAVGQLPPYTVAGCSFTLPSGTPSPCASATWTVTALRVTSMGVPLVLQNSTAVCIPNGTGLQIAFAGQVRVQAT